MSNDVKDRGLTGAILDSLTDAALLQQICDGMAAASAPLPRELSEGDEA